MAGFKDFREIVAWQLANQLKSEVDRYLARPEFKLRFKYRDQFDDAARSAPRNIAEGFARFRHKVLNHFIDAHDQRLITTDELLMAEHLTRRALKAANGLIRYLESTPDPPPPKWKPGPKPPEPE